MTDESAEDYVAPIQNDLIHFTLDSYNFIIGLGI